MPDLTNLPSTLATKNAWFYITNSPDYLEMARAIQLGYPLYSVTRWIRDHQAVILTASAGLLALAFVARGRR